MKFESYKIFPLGIDALTIEFGNEISVELNDLAIGLSKYFENNNFAGFIETVPAYSSLTIFYDVFKVRKSFPEFSTAFETIRYFTENALYYARNTVKNEARSVEIPVDFSEEFALDLKFIASNNNLSPKKCVEIFTNRSYRVFMLGFLPAFAYMGEVDERLAVPRKSSPRLNIPRGSVGIAGRQTGIYPFSSPGGWQIIGRTDFNLFMPHAENPCALQAGDTVKFYASDK